MAIGIGEHDFVKLLLIMIIDPKCFDHKTFFLAPWTFSQIPGCLNISDSCPIILIILNIFSFLVISPIVTLENSPTDWLLEAALVGDPGRLFRIPRVTTDGLKVASYFPF